MSVCSCICLIFTASWTGASADEVCQYYGGQPYHHGCLSVSLTYHMIIIIMMPIIIAGMYTSKQLSIYTFVLTVLSIIISTYAGYYYGVCDANMVLLTTTSMNHLVENGIFLLNQVNENPESRLHCIMCCRAV